MKNTYTWRNEPLTMAEALAIQKEHLRQWASVLNPDAAKKLVELATKDNATQKNPYEIVRGEMLYEIVSNQLMER